MTTNCQSVQPFVARIFVPTPDMTLEQRSPTHHGTGDTERRVHTGRLRKRGTPINCVLARVCREASARVTFNAFLQDLNIHAGSTHSCKAPRRPCSHHLQKFGDAPTAASSYAWIQSYTTTRKIAQDTMKRLQKVVQPGVIQTKNSQEFIRACEDSCWNMLEPRQVNPKSIRNQRKCRKHSPWSERKGTSAPGVFQKMERETKEWLFQMRNIQDKLADMQRSWNHEIVGNIPMSWRRCISKIRRSHTISNFAPPESGRIGRGRSALFFWRGRRRSRKLL